MKDLVSIFSTQSGEPIGDHTKSLFFGTVPIKNMIEETSRLLLNDYPKITGFSFSVLLKNISENNGQLIQSCMCEKDEGGLVPGMFFVNLNNEDFNFIYKSKDPRIIKRQ